MDCRKVIKPRRFLVPRRRNKAQLQSKKGSKFWQPQEKKKFTG